MKNSWRHYLRRLATVTVVCGSVAWSSAMCYAARLAFDRADDPVYANGWQEGDNGGTNFTAWNFHGTYTSTVQQRIDDGIGSGALGSSTFNDIERAWSLFNPVVVTGQRDIARAGRGFAPLTVGQTLKVVIDNPSEERFFRGYFVRLTGDTGGVNGNICSDGTPVGLHAGSHAKAEDALPNVRLLYLWRMGNRRRRWSGPEFRWRFLLYGIVRHRHGESSGSTSGGHGLGSKI